MNELTQRGIAALKAGDRLTARKLLASAVQQDKNDLAAWLWLAGALDGDDERISCLRQVLRLDPGNQAAARGLAQILERRTRPAVARSGSDEGTAPRESAVQPPAVSESATTTPHEPPALSESATTTSHEPPAPSESAIPTPAPAPDAWRGLTWDTAPEPQPETPPTHPPVAGVFAEDTIPGTAQVDEPPAEAAPSGAYDWNAAAAAAVGRTSTAIAAATSTAAAETNAVVAAEPAAQETAAGAPYQPKRSKESYLPMRRIFTTRPSLVPSLLCFWLFFFGTVYAGNLLARNAPMQAQINIVPQALMQNPVKVQASTAFALAMGLILELVVIYATLRIFTIRYELTNQTLTLRFRGKRARVPLEYIYNAECKQSFIQTMIGTGHLDLDLAVNGELAHVRLRDIPDCKKRREQIMYLVQDLS